MNAPERLRPMGIVRGMSFEDYLAVDAMSQSGMKTLARSAWHYRHRQPVKPTRRMFTGTLAHCALLEPDALAARYVVAPDNAPRRPTAAQWAAKKPSLDSAAAMAWWADFNARASGREVVTHEEFTITQQQLQAVLAVPELEALLRQGEAEVSVFWIDAETGIYCKARPDFVHALPDGRDILLDLKTTADESPAGFARIAANLGYYRQDAHYRAGWQAATGREVAAFLFAAVSAAPPVLAVPYLLDDEALELGERERRRLLARYADSLRTDAWPAYGAGVQMLSLPAWATCSTLETTE